MPDVIEVVHDTLLDARVAAPTVDLRPAGDARLHAVTEHVLRNLLAELIDEHRALGPRADEAHVAAEHVEELRNLVEARAAQPPADRRRAIVALRRPHRAG